ncbi:MAG: ribosome hibernation-promoting factor, HPF/YfiA family, partial [Actinomycetes bacterium]
DIIVKGRRTKVAERFRRQVEEKLAKIERLDHTVSRAEVVLSEERNPRLADVSDRVEITLYSRGPVVRAEAAAGDPLAALDLASSRLEGQLRKAGDRRRVHHGHRTPESLATAATALDPTAAPDQAAAPGQEGSAPPGVDEGPLVIRDKTHAAAPMTLDQALYEMELVGHDFYLFVDADSRRPSVVYRRRGYDYGVIRLDVGR